MLYFLAGPPQLAAYNVADWPIGEVAAPLHEVRSVTHGGPDLLRSSSSHLDP
jgi:hypothetical protein